LELDRLAENVDSLFATVAVQELGGDRIFAVNKYHEDLHKRIAECARSQLLQSQIDKSHVLVFNWLYDIARGRRMLPANFHRDLVDNIVKGNPQQAEEAMRQHVIYGLESVQHAMEPLDERNWRLKH
jgi:DNA-binding FadR family transcriptional regulator